MGSAQYATIDSSTKVLEECRLGEWSRVRVIEPEWLQDSHRGWVANRFLLSQKDFDATGFTEEDFLFDGKTRPYKDVIVRGVNKIAREDPRCRGSIDPGSAYISGSKGTPDRPVFFVTCGKGLNVVNVFFSEDDLAPGKMFTAPVHMNKELAVSLCEDYAKNIAANPSTVSFSTFWDLAITEHLNGRTTVISSFKAKNAFGLELEYDIRCLLQSSGLIEANISEKR